MIDFGAKLIEVRKSKGLTQDEVAEKCKITVRTIQRIESGKVKPRTFTIKVISESLGFDFFETSNTFDVSTKDQNSNLKKHTILWYIKDLFNLKTNTMKKVSILTTLCLTIGFTLFIIRLESNAQPLNEKENISYAKNENHQKSLKTKERIQVAFTNELTFENLISIKKNLNIKGITINYKKIEFDENNQLLSIHCDVNCNDGFKGSFSIDNLNTINKEKRIGFYRDYSKKSKSPFGTGILKKIIIIDIGHGGLDNGNKINEITEKDIALNIANKIKQLYNNPKVAIFLTRDSDEFISLENRVEFINSLNPEYVISLHVNSSKNETDNGFDFFISTENRFKEKSNELSKKIINSLQKSISINEIKNANYFILKNINCPATLIEMGYLTNPNDKKLLTSEKGQIKIATAIVEAIK